MSEKNEWKPIDSAPKDGTGILGYWDVGGIHDCNFRAVKFHRGAWWETNEDYKVREPTHWMPLPAAPGSTSSAPGDAQDERQAFEAWAEDQGFVLDCDFFEVSGQYYDQDDTQLAYDIWRAARASVAAAGDALDAARYRWLRDQTETDGIAIVMKNKHFDASRTCAENIDKLIDAALAAQVPHKGDAA